MLDGDLAADCRVRAFEEKYPERFIENGIAEQDMVSMAGGLARTGLLPVVNSFASFLASRANEQIYNNATERSKVIYVCHFGGLIRRVRASRTRAYATSRSSARAELHHPSARELRGDPCSASLGGRKRRTGAS